MLCIALAAIHTLFEHRKPASSSLFTAQSTTNPIQTEYTRYLGQKEEKIWENLATIGIEKDTCMTQKTARYQEFLDYAHSQWASDRKVSENTEKLVHTVLNDFGIDPAKITVTACDEWSPACADDTTIYINEALLANYSPTAQRFAIAHELQHLKNKDISTDYFMGQMPIKPEHKDQRTATIAQYHRFREERADIQTAIHSLEWADAYVTFMQEVLRRMGDTNDPSHPKNSERLKTAQIIAQKMEQSAQSGIQVA